MMAQLSKGEMIAQAQMSAGAVAQASPVGDIYFVDSVNGNDGNDGKAKHNALQTLAQAVSLAGAGDTIVCEPGGTETITATIALSTARVKIVCKVTNPRSGYAVSGAGTLDLITATAADLHLEGLQFKHSSGEANASCVLASAATHRLTLKNCVFDDLDTDPQGGVGLEQTAGADDLRVEGCLFLDTAYGVQIVASSTNVSDRPVIQDSEFFVGGSAWFGIHMAAATGAVQGARLLRCLFHEAHGDGSVATAAWDGSNGADATQGPILFGAAVDQYMIQYSWAQTALSRTFENIQAINAGANGEIVDCGTAQAGDVTNVYSDTTILVSDTSAIHSQTTVILSDALVIESDSVVIESQTTVILSDALAIESDAMVIESQTTKILSDSSQIESDLIEVASDVRHVDSDVTDIQSDTVIIESQATKILSDSTAIHSQTTVIESDSIIVSSDTVVIESQTTVILSDALAIESDTVVIESQATKILSDSTAIHSQTTVIESDSIIVSSDTLVIESQTTKILSDGQEIYSDTTEIHSQTTKILSDSTAIHSQTTVIESDSIIVSSDTVVIESQATKILSDSTAIHSQTTVLESDSIIVSSDTVVIESQATKILSDSTAIHSQTTVIESDVVSAGRPVAKAGTITDTDLENNAQDAGDTMCTATGGDVMIEEIVLTKDANALAGPNNIEATTDNVYGETGVNDPIVSNAIAALDAQGSLIGSAATVGKLPCILESTKKLYLHGDDAAGSSGGAVKYAIKGRALADGAYLV